MSDQQPPEDPWPAEDPFAPPGSVPAAPQPPQAQGPGIRTDTGEVLEDEGPSVGERLERLEEAVADIAELLRLSPGGPWAWHMLEPPARRELAEKLVTWVEWLSSRYLANLSQEKVFELPPRWFTNPVFVELMTALYVGYLSVYSPRQRVPSMALIEWHERGLWPTLDRIKALGIVRNGELVTTTYTVSTDDDAEDVIAGVDADEPGDADTTAGADTTPAGTPSSPPTAAVAPTAGRETTPGGAR